MTSPKFSADGDSRVLAVTGPVLRRCPGVTAPRQGAPGQVRHTSSVTPPESHLLSHTSCVTPPAFSIMCQPQNACAAHG